MKGIAESTITMVRYVVHFTGHVQGVGFRYSAVHIAADYQVAGFVQNLPDGRVMMVAEGSKDQIDGFVNAICQRMAGNIERYTSAQSDVTGQFGTPGTRGGFDVRF